MHILYIPSWYSTSSNPGRGRFFRDQAFAIKKAGHQVGLIVPPSRFRTWHGIRQAATNWQKSNTSFDLEIDNEMPIYRIPWWGWIPSIYVVQRPHLVLKAFDRYCEANGIPEIVHAHSVLYAGYCGLYIKQQRNIPLIITEHLSSYLRNLLWPDQRYIIQKTLNRADKLLAVSSSLAEAMQKYAPNQTVEVIGNSVNTDFFMPTSNPIPDSPFYFTLIANLNDNKGVDVLLRAFQSASFDNDVHLRIIGDGPALPALQEMASNLGIQNSVTFSGRLRPDDVRNTIQNSHVIVSSSYVETFGMTLIEAMACGKPIIATDSGGPSQYINPNNGLLVPPGNISAMTSALQQMVRKYRDYDSQVIRTECLERFSEQSFVKRLEALYLEVLTS
jgi:L-malate glycosyltransferase